MGRQAFLDIVDHAVRDRVIRFVDSKGDIAVGGRDVGNGGATPPIVVQVHRESFYSRVLAQGNLGLGEAYVARDFEVVDGSLEDLLETLLRHRVPDRIRGNWRLLVRAAASCTGSILASKTRNVRRHYDIGADLFECFLDPTLTYSFGYARHVNDDLETLQYNKLDRICRKLRLADGQRVLDIGCGFGGLLIFAATHYRIHGVGVSNSAEHVRLARERVKQVGLTGSIRIELGDYTDASGQFDKIASVGMMEHVPRREYSKYIRTFRRLLKTDGLALIHTIGCVVNRNRHDPFIQRYIFPGSNQPKLSEIARELEKYQLPIHDVENLARHYYYTTRAWLDRFRQSQSWLDEERYPTAFRRMWEYYLACGVAASRASDGALFQVLFAADTQSDVPRIRV
jgi:cyclopropane-fatty-acyl-phospholipid synthase